MGEFPALLDRHRQIIHRDIGMNFLEHDAFFGNGFKVLQHEPDAAARSREQEDKNKGGDDDFFVLTGYFSW
jgi:hypothetical protein